MWSHLDAWRRSATALGVEISGPLQIALPSGRNLTVDMWVKGFGALRGMLVFTHSDQFWDFRQELSEDFGYSCFEPGKSGHESTVEDMIDVLSDWGWAGEGPAPAWLREPPADEQHD